MQLSVVYIVGIALAVTAIACGKTSSTKTEMAEETKWNVTVNKVIYNIDGDDQYTVADTARVNSEITSGSCSVSIPADKIHEYLPNLDLEKLKQYPFGISS